MMMTSHRRKGHPTKKTRDLRLIDYLTTSIVLKEPHLRALILMKWKEKGGQDPRENQNLNNNGHP